MRLGLMGVGYVRWLQSVSRYRNNFQVGWVHTRLVMAEMVELHPKRNLTDERFIGEAMSEDPVSPTFDRELIAAIAMLV